MENNKKRKYMLIAGPLVLFIALIGLTYAFFNYTRTGARNVIKTGRIAFNTEQNTPINLTNMFPIDVSNGVPSDPNKVGSVTINVTGDTTYEEGVEYKVSAVNVSNTVGSGANAKTLPISVSVNVTSNASHETPTTLGTSNENYFTAREEANASSMYKVLASDTISNNDDLLVGYIAPGATGVDGNIVIKAYIDKAKVGISDTYPEATIRTVETTGYSSNTCTGVLTGVTNASTYCATASSLQDAIDNEDLAESEIALLVNAGIVSEYTNGTPASFGTDREVFTTEEWNSLQTNGVSFQIRIEANEGLWVESPFGPICIRATSLHTETCVNESGYCYTDGYTGNNSTITYGNTTVTSGEIHTGDAFDCDVDGTGYNQRFYYVSDYYDTSNNTFDNTTATLIYYDVMVKDGTSRIAYDSSGENWHGPRTAITNLPTSQNWSNIELKNASRKILACDNVDCSNTPVNTTNNGNNTISNSFSYDGYAARLLTLQELKMAGCDELSQKASLGTNGSLKACAFMFEGTKYADSSRSVNGSLLETVDASTSNRTYLHYSYYSKVDLIAVSNTYYGVRPTIDVPYLRIDY